MKLLAAFALLFTLGAVPCLGQAADPEPKPPADAQTLQAILVELRGIHNDVRLGQTSQILLAEMQIQHDAVNRARQRRDDLRSMLTNVQLQEKNLTVEIPQLEEAANAAVDTARKKQLTDNETQIKTLLANLKTQEQNQTDELHDAEAQLIKEQDGVQNVQDQLDAVIKQMQPAGRP